MRPTTLLPTLIAGLALAASPSLRAGGDHDHAAPTPAAQGSSLPRFAATADALELVGVVQGPLITLYLDRAADNAPVTDAEIALELQQLPGSRFTATPHEGSYEVTLPDDLLPGDWTVTAEVKTGRETTRMSAEFEVEAPPHEHEEGAGRWRALRWAVGALLGLAAVAGAVLLGRRARARRLVRAGGAA